MRTIDYFDVLNGTLYLCGFGPDEAKTDVKRFRDFHSNRLRTAWRFAPWPELTRVEQRQFRQDWAVGTTYAAGAERYYPVSQGYYVALRASTGEAPDDGDGNTNNAYWARLDSNDAGAANEWVTGTVYAVGDRVVNLTDRLTYQCHTAHTAGASFDSTKFGEVPEFIRSLDYDQSWETNEIGDVLEVFDRNPRTNWNAQPVRYEVENDRIIVLDNDVVTVWVQYRQPVPRLFGDEYASGTAYTAGQQIYYSAGAVRGDFYTVLETTTAGQTPESHASKFSKVSIPEVFGAYLKQGAFADYLPAEGEAAERRAMEQARAERLLADEWMSIAQQQRQRPRTKVLVR